MSYQLCEVWKKTGAITPDLRQRCRPNAGDLFQLDFGYEQQPFGGIDATGDQGIDGAVGKTTVLKW
jgi:hypothetical protein